MKRFVLTRPAERDLEQIKLFLVRNAGPVIARRVLKHIRHALSLLGDQPGEILAHIAGASALSHSAKFDVHGLTADMK